MRVDNDVNEMLEGLLDEDYSSSTESNVKPPEKRAASNVAPKPEGKKSRRESMTKVDPVSKEFYGRLQVQANWVKPDKYEAEIKLLAYNPVQKDFLVEVCIFLDAKHYQECTFTSRHVSPYVQKGALLDATVVVESSDKYPKATISIE